MPLICYEPKEFSAERLRLIAIANQRLKALISGGFSVTLRQLYYQMFEEFPDEWRRTNKGGKFVKDPNGSKNNPMAYNAFGNLIADARMAGLIDWDYIVDRTRSSYQNQHWARPSQILGQTIATYQLDRWANQDHYVECWVEKEAMENVLATACQPLDVRFYCCRGYNSASAMWEAAQRLLVERDKGKQVHVLYLGDHDPSGIHMSQDVYCRLQLFMRGQPVHVQRVALNIGQVKKHNLPPSPTKTTDSRAETYIEQFGYDCWELDALQPAVLVGTITRAIEQFRDKAKWEEQLALEKRGKTTLETIVKYYPDVIKFLRERRKEGNQSRVICETCGATEDNPLCVCIEKKGGQLE